MSEQDTPYPLPHVVAQVGGSDGPTQECRGARIGSNELGIDVSFGLDGFRRSGWSGQANIELIVRLVNGWLNTAKLQAPKETNVMRSLIALSLLLVTGCTSPYGASSVLPTEPSNLSTMRQITGRADKLETLQPEPGDIWAAEPPTKPTPTASSAQPRNSRAATRGEAPLTPPPLSHAGGDFWRMPELEPAPRS